MSRLSADQLSFAYSDKRILDQVSLQLRPGELTVLLGANGAGKTTLLHALSGQLKPQSGAATLDDQDIRTLSRRDVARKIALMPQYENRELALTVRDVISLGRCPHRGWWMPMTPQDQAQIDDAINVCGLTELVDREVGGLSGGEWRRMILARSLAQDSSVLLLDEPTAGLDLKYQLDVLRRVRQFAIEKQLTVVMTLHNLNHAAFYADTIALLHGGNLLAVGAAKEVLTPDNIRTAFGVSVMVMKHPIGDRVMIVPLDGDQPAP